MAADMAKNLRRSTTRTIFFDLDSTLFDHCHSLSHAIIAVREYFPSLQAYPLEDLIAKYASALESSYDAYLRKEIAHDELNTAKVAKFYRTVDNSHLTSELVQDFRVVYRSAYQANYRATPGSIEMLQRLCLAGYTLAIITNGKKNDQRAKAEAIGVAAFVARIFTSEEAGVCKPNRGIFSWALDVMNVHCEDCIMVGDSIESDIKGALDASMLPVLYDPLSQDGQRVVDGCEVPVISDMIQLLKLLGLD